MFGRKKKKEDSKPVSEAVIDTAQPGREITILVTEKDKTGSDVMEMSDFFSVALQEYSKELIASNSLFSINELPIADLSIVNDAIQAVGVFMSREFDLVPDFSALPKDILDRFKAGELIIGDSKQVEGNLRAVLIDAETKERVKDLTLKKVDRPDASADISRDILNQMQLKQISDKLDFMISEQSYLIDFTRNQDILTPFLDARDNILKAQNKVEYGEQKECLLKAADKLHTAINSVYVDINTITGHLAEEGHKKFYRRLNRKGIDAQISRLTADTIILTKYVGMQMQVYHYIGDETSSKNVLETYRSCFNRFFEKGIVSPNKSLALFIHENVKYSDSNMDCWYHMEERMKPFLNQEYDHLESKAVYVITGGEENE